MLNLVDDEHLHSDSREQARHFVLELTRTRE
jgi:hypothetical protein